jgi:diguanylate cyclase (GGDEF)-like protein/PAS domain S-box-containing protein
VSQALMLGIATAGHAAILVVDDNAGKRLSITSVLETLGHTIIEAESGEAALRAVLTQTFAVILMDVQMPEMDGYETARLIRIRDQSKSTPIIFVTAHAAEEATIPVAYESGAVDFIFAPIVPDVLRAKVAIFAELFLKSRELERSLDHIRDSEVRTRAVLENIADGIVTLSGDGTIQSFNRAAAELFGYGEEEAIGQAFSVMVGPRYPGDYANPEDAERQLLSPQLRRGRSAESVGRRKDGSTFPMELDLSDVVLASSTMHIACLRDISERQSYTETLQHQALHDALTGLPNRVLFADRVTHAIRVALRSGESLALLVMDLDEFKQVNDTLGHQHGDVLLKLVTERLLGCLREGDTVARLGGDEFGILLRGNIDLAGAASVVWKIQQALEPTFIVDGHAMDVRASIGIVLAPGHGNNVDELLRRADLAMYDAKRSGGGYALFATEQEETPARRLALLTDLRRCIERDELVLHFQPKIDLATQETIGVEALTRWNHPSGRLFMPADFMPEVERSELMIPLTAWVINESLRQLRIWRDEGYDLTMAVNLGARCFAEGPGIFETIDELTSRWGIPPDKRTFELTESALIDTAVPGMLARLQNMDERLSIDDFGTGYSSLVYLQRLPVVEIKADRSFVMTMCSVKDDAVIVRSIIDLAHNLGLKVVAEGVEDKATMDLLNEYGCDEAQGYYFSRPVPGEDLSRWLETSSFGVPRRLDVSTASGSLGSTTAACRAIPTRSRTARSASSSSA